ncbi:MAG: pyridoxal 5'-phosphate synthase glutaminase subunit PdxT [Thermoleophilia bacterium]|nr:pyridoxal 5'-phosphate synthase glutaminase subunit PdxT [Thermoleophilia bacterium]
MSDGIDHATTTTALPAIGVLAMQGAFAEHIRALGDVGAPAIEVRTTKQLDRCSGIVIPGGESTAIRKALDRCGLLEPLRARIEQGMPAFGTCAGMIVLADTEPDGAPPCLGLLDVDVERNGWGRQVHSAEVAVAYEDGSTSSSIFIRAPRITRLGDAVEVVARIAGGGADGEPVAVRQGHLLAAAFHPELTADRALHRTFAAMVDAHATSPARR